MNKELYINLYDISFYKYDKDGNEELDDKGNIKIYRIKEGVRYKPLEYICEDLNEDMLEESSDEN